MKLQRISNMSSRAVFAILAGLLLSSITPALGQNTCVTRSQPNPIAQQYPDLPTGTLNATIAILPIPLKVARKIIPSKWKILTKPYRALLPNFPHDKYPVFLQVALDHDIQVAAFNFSFPDFHKAGFSFPFLDLLNDGYTSFTWTPTQLISYDNLAAIAGGEMYGQAVYPASFDPECDPYRFLTGPASGPPHKPNKNKETYAKGSSVPVNGTNPKTFVEIQFEQLPNPNKSPYPLSFYKNITNQPVFGDGLVCNQQIRFFNTSISLPPFAPKFVKGSIGAYLPPMEKVKKGKGLEYHGLQIDTAFIEFNGVDCQSLQGFDGVPGVV